MLLYLFQRTIFHDAGIQRFFVHDKRCCLSPSSAFQVKYRHWNLIAKKSKIVWKCTEKKTLKKEPLNTYQVFVIIYENTFLQILYMEFFHCALLADFYTWHSLSTSELFRMSIWFSTRMIFRIMHLYTQMHTSPNAFVHKNTSWC